jgi:peptidoglycan/LPS O-acetylase OafA/YrhL
LRALAVAGVAIGHAGVPNNGGYHGVTVFFVISGYLISTILLRQILSNNGLRLADFYIRRFGRLTPALVLALLSTAVWLGLTGGLNENAIGLAAAATYTTDILAYTALADDITMYTQWSWSLGIEEQFYLIWPVVLMFLIAKTNRPRGAVIVISGVIASLWIWRAYLSASDGNHERIFYAPDTHIDALLLGCLLAVVFAFSWRREISVVGTRIATYVGLVSLFLVLAKPGIVRVFGPVDQDGFGLAALSCGLLLTGLINNRNTYVFKLLQARILVYIGKLSYGLYLYNVLTVQIFEYYIGTKPAMTPLGILWVVALFATSISSYHLIESPIRNWVNKKHPGRPISSPEILVKRIEHG